MALTLATVETAIETLLSGGQSATVDGMTYTQASLPGLMEMRRELQREANVASRPVIRGVKFGSIMP